MNNLIIVDTREKGHKKILEYFDSVQQDYIISKLDTGDYMAYKDYSVIIDKKDGLEELCKNLCSSKEHERVAREIDRAHDLGCERFIFLIQTSKFKSIDDVNKWFSPHTKVKGFILQKVMRTFKEHHNVEFIFCPQEDMGKTIIDILTNK